jgi:uncharacterized protein
MMLSDDKISHLTHVVLRGLLDKKLLSFLEDESKVRGEIKRTIIGELKVGEEIDAAVRRKLQSYARKPVEGSPEWEILYKKFFKEEEVRRGRATG